MPSEKNLKSIFSDIATQIREKLKTTDLIKPYNMADKIKEISSGVDFKFLRKSGVISSKVKLGLSSINFRID